MALLWRNSARIGMDHCGLAWMGAAGGWTWMDSDGRSLVLRRVDGSSPAMFVATSATKSRRLGKRRGGDASSSRTASPTAYTVGRVNDD